MHKPIISVVVCTYNRAELLPACLDSLVNQTLDKSLYEVIVVDNKSSDATYQLATGMAATQPNFFVFIEPKQGVSHARNKGWEVARGDYVLYIDDDAKAMPDWCERILQAFETVTPKPVAVGGSIHPFYGVPPPDWFADEFECRTWGTEPGFLQLPRARYGFSGSNMAICRSIFTVFGGFHAGFGPKGEKFALGEESQFFMRIYNENPWFWYDPEIKVLHWTPARNMKVSYRFWRSFKSGQASASMNGRKQFSVSYLRKWLGLGLLFLRLPLRVLKSEKKFKTELVRQMEELGHRLGYLISRSNVE